MATRSKKSKPKAAAKKGVRKVRKAGTRSMAKRYTWNEPLEPVVP